MAVQIVERFVLAKLRNRTFFSLAELNAAIKDCVAAINAKVMRKIGASRAELLETLDRPALKTLPATAYEYAEWKRARVAPDYHIEIAGHYYSVPSRLIREIVEARITTTTVEIFHKGQRVAAGMMVALVVFAGSMCRPVGGWLADRFGGLRTLQVLFAVVALCYLSIAYLPQSAEIDRSFPIEAALDAYRYQASAALFGKVVITL